MAAIDKPLTDVQRLYAEVVNAHLRFSKLQRFYDRVAKIFMYISFLRKPFIERTNSFLDEANDLLSRAQKKKDKESYRIATELKEDIVQYRLFKLPRRFHAAEYGVHPEPLGSNF